MVCDAHGRKMSKSLGNVINPEDVISGISLEVINVTVLSVFMYQCYIYSVTFTLCNYVSVLHLLFRNTVKPRLFL